MLYFSSLDCCLQKVANDSQVLVAARASESDLAVAPPFSSQLNPRTDERDERRLELENKESANISHDDETSLPMSQDIDSQKLTLQDSPSNPERLKQEQSAILVQAAFRGYLVFLSYSLWIFSINFKSLHNQGITFSRYHSQTDTSSLCEGSPSVLGTQRDYKAASTYSWPLG